MGGVNSSAPAFMVNGVQITVGQRAACQAVMKRDSFTTTETVQALVDAGVPPDEIVAHRAADRLRQAARKAGEIRPGKGRGVWERVK